MWSPRFNIREAIDAIENRIRTVNHKEPIKKAAIKLHRIAVITYQRWDTNLVIKAELKFFSSESRRMPKKGRLSFVEAIVYDPHQKLSYGGSYQYWHEEQPAFGEWESGVYCDNYKKRMITYMPAWKRRLTWEEFMSEDVFLMAKALSFSTKE